MWGNETFFNKDRLTLITNIYLKVMSIHSMYLSFPQFFNSGLELKTFLILQAAVSL